jgi:hypothetical protein
MPSGAANSKVLGHVIAHPLFFELDKHIQTEEKKTCDYW